MKELSCSILVCSSDGYDDLWHPFFTLLFMYWPNCPYQVYLGSETKIFTHKRVNTLLSGANKSWSECLADYLDKIDSDYVLVMLEDFFIVKNVDNERIALALHDLDDLEGIMMRVGRNKISPSRGIFGPVSSNPYCCEILPGYPYRVSLQAALWRKNYLKTLCVDGESIWSFETNGSIRSYDQASGFYCTTEEILPYFCHVVEKGKWFRHKARIFKKMNIGCDFEKREIMTLSEQFIWRIYKVRWLVRNDFPKKLSRYVGRVFKWIEKQFRYYK